MANFFLDNKDLQFHMNHPLMKKIVELKEKGYADKDAYDYAPVDFEDAQDSYRRVSSSVEQMEGVAQKQNNYLQTSKPHLTKTVRINNIPTRCVVLRLPQLENDDFEPLGYIPD